MILHTHRHNAPRQDEQEGHKKTPPSSTTCAQTRGGPKHTYTHTSGNGGVGCSRSNGQNQGAQGGREPPKTSGRSISQAPHAAVEAPSRTMQSKQFIRQSSSSRTHGQPPTACNGAVPSGPRDRQPPHAVTACAHSSSTIETPAPGAAAGARTGPASQSQSMHLCTVSPK
jgi:hypothetical protein